MRRTSELLGLAAIVFVAGWLRLGNLELAEFKYDEAVALELTLPLVESGDLPKVGLVSSVHVKNPPMLMYLLAIPMLVAVDPLVVSGFVGLLGTLAVLATYGLLRGRFGPFVALVAAGLFATAPWAVLYSRKIWAQDLLPLFTIALLHVLLVVLERPRTRLVFWVPVLLCVLWQLHLSAFAAIVAAGSVLAYAARRLRAGALAIGCVAALALLAPYLWHQATHHWEDFRLIGKLASGSGPGAQRPADLRGFSYLVDICGSLGWRYVMGGSSGEFARAAPAARACGQVASWVVAVLLVVGLFATAVRLIRRACPSPRYPFLEWDVEEERRGMLGLWVVSICAFFVIARLEGVFRHYLIITYPAPFAVIALLLGDLRRLAPARFARVAGAATIAIPVAIACGFLVFGAAFYGFIRDRGGTAGDYGVAFRHKDEVVRYAQANRLEIGPAPVEILQLAALRRRYPRERPVPAPALPGRMLEVQDRLRADALTCPPEQARSFGPLETCIR